MPRMVVRSSRWRRMAASFWGVMLRSIGLRVKVLLQFMQRHRAVPARLVPCFRRALSSWQWGQEMWGQEIVIMPRFLPSIRNTCNAGNYMTQLRS